MAPIYATVAQLRRELNNQVPAGAEIDTDLERKLIAAETAINSDLGFSFATAAPGEQVVYGDGTIYLLPPAFVAGSVTMVEQESGLTVPDYIEQGNMLIVTDADGVIVSERRYLESYGLSGLAWGQGVPYTVTANFGYSGIPADITEITLQLAARLWRARAAGFSDVVGVVGSSAVGYNGQLPAFARLVLDNYRDRRSPGVY